MPTPLPIRCPRCGKEIASHCLKCGYHLPPEQSALMASVYKVLGKIEEKENREPHGDKFYTPPHAVLSLLDRERFDGTTWEPAQGDGRIVRIMRKRGCKIFGSDIDEGKDFFKINRRVENIVTNPPYTDKDDWLVHAKECATHKVALLLELSALTGVGRYDLLQDRKFPLASVNLFARPVVFDLPNGEKHESLLPRHAWCVWDKRHKGEPVIRFIDPAEIERVA